jgi:hypothetical protein
VIDDSSITLPGIIHGVNEVSFIENIELNEEI